ncbi:ADP-ribosylation factor-like protein 6 [Trichonephila clavipes]|nr:ADP-ribosylation factor-like protein 6 [Trichonephila clavipes]
MHCTDCKMFGFPKEDSLRKKWIQAISRKYVAPSKYSKVCELHFSDDAIRRYTEAYNERTGEKICVPLKHFRLQNFAVPTIFIQISPHIFLTLEIPLENVLSRDCKD